MSDENNINVDSALEDIFSSSIQMNDVEVKLPSLAKGYKNTSKIIKIRPMTYEDEKFISSHSTDNLLDALLDRCTIGVDLEELYLEDKLFLYYKLRECSFGSDAKISSRCQSCNTMNDLEVDLSKLNVEYADDTFENPKEIDLPIIQKAAKVLKIQAYNQIYSKNQTTLLDNLWRFIPKLGDCEDPIIIAKAVKLLSSADIRALIKHINTTDFGLNTDVKFICNSCRNESVAAVGLSFDFFTQS